MGQGKIKNDKRLAKLSDKRTLLEKERDKQVQNKKDWDDYMDQHGLSGLNNFNFLPQLKVLITEEMIDIDKQKPVDQRWKHGDLYPTLGTYTHPKAISEEEALLKLQKLQDLESQNVATVEVVNDNGDVEKLETKLEMPKQKAINEDEWKEIMNKYTVQL